MSGLNGIICVNKPQNFTSFDIIAIMRKAAGTRKIGHGGTLDPMATGVLPVFIGRAAKSADLNPVADKSYKAGFKLGITSDTEDIWGSVLSQDGKAVTLSELLAVTDSIQGNIMQTPPMYSAVKVGGKKLYELARQGIEVERKARPITVHKIEVVAYDENTREGEMTVHCSKGTYIRTLISDIGKTLGTGAVMTSLCRTLSGGFTLGDCVDIEDIRGKTPEEIARYIIPTEKIYLCYPEITLDNKQRKMFMNGVVLDCKKMNLSYCENTVLRIKDENGVFLGLGETDSENGIRIKLLNVLQ